MALDVCILNNQLIVKSSCNYTNQYICYFNNSIFAVIYHGNYNWMIFQENSKKNKASTKINDGDL